MKRYIYVALLMLIIFSGTMMAQGISVSAPSHVSTGENFRISYTIASQDVDDFRCGKIPAGIEVIVGPYTSRQSSYQIVNGRTSSSSSITYTYTLYAEKAGTYSISPAHARVGGKAIASRLVHIKVSGATRKNGASAPNMHDDDHEMSAPSGHISGSDLFVKVSASKRRVHEQEPILLTYKVYTLVDLTSLDGKMPDLTGFHTQEVPLPQQKSFHIENFKGRNYRCVTWSQYVMYPQMTGKLSIPSITFKGVVLQQNRAVDPFEAFLNGGSGYTEVKRNIVAPGLDIQVDPLPAKPTDFSGGVGKFTITSQLDHATVKAGNPLTLRVVIGGTGNLKLIKQPVCNFPKDFDKYDPKVTDKTKLTANGLEGNMIYDFLVVPRNQGTYKLPPISFTYFDTAAGSYKTISTQPLSVVVEKGDGKANTAVDYADNKPTDIKGIKTGDATILGVNGFYFGSLRYWILLLMPFVVFVVVIVIFRKRALDNSDIVRMKGKRANKVAAKRLKASYKLMLAAQKDQFYDEVLRALWGYVSDKMNIPVAQLSRENINEQLMLSGINADIIDKFIAALDECEFERYAPGDAAGNMSRTYDTAMEAIMQIENEFKEMKQKGKRTSSTLAGMLLLVVVGLLTLVPAQAATKASADAQYAKGNYQQAATEYVELLKTTPSAETYYNLGNAYYRLGNITQSIIAYERSLRFAPGDADARYNLDFLYSKTIDKITPADEMFFYIWYRSLVNSCSIDAWAHLSTIAFVATLLLVLLFLFGSSVALRKTGFYGALVCLCFFAFTTLFAWQQQCAFEERNKAVVTAPTINVKKTPSDTASDAFVIHEGTPVTIIDRTMKQWYNIRLADNKEGWVPANFVEVI